MQMAKVKGQRYIYICTTIFCCNENRMFVMLWLIILLANIVYLLSFQNRIDSVMISMLGWSMVDRGFGPRSGQIKDYQIGVCCFSTKNTY